MAILGAEVLQHGPAGIHQFPYGTFSGKASLNLGTITRAIVATGKFDVGITLTGVFDIGRTSTGKFDVGVTLTGEGDETS